MKQGMFTITANRRLTQNVCEMILAGDTSACQRPGQFLNIKLDGLFLRRPISVCDYDDEKIKIIYKIVGKDAGDGRDAPRANAGCADRSRQWL
mgnify:CR=1 FL=1